MQSFCFLPFDVFLSLIEVQKLLLNVGAYYGFVVLVFWCFEFLLRWNVLTVSCVRPRAMNAQVGYLPEDKQTNQTIVR
jgi:hypothetical protein